MEIDSRTVTISPSWSCDKVTMGGGCPVAEHLIRTLSPGAMRCTVSCGGTDKFAFTGVDIIDG